MLCSAAQAKAPRFVTSCHPAVLSTLVVCTRAYCRVCTHVTWLTSVGTGCALYELVKPESVSAKKLLVAKSVTTGEWLYVLLFVRTRTMSLAIRSHCAPVVIAPQFGKRWAWPLAPLSKSRRHRLPMPA